MTNKQRLIALELACIRQAIKHWDNVIKIVREEPNPGGTFDLYLAPLGKDHADNPTKALRGIAWIEFTTDKEPCVWYRLSASLEQAPTGSGGTPAEYAPVIKWNLV